jgi:N-acetyl-alpha-D-muramate 1-phosphate uridylyltransferase
MTLRMGSPTEKQAVILAGGLGTRMRPITETIPKPMIAVAGKPFLEWQLKLLRSGGIANALLLVRRRAPVWSIHTSGRRLERAAR